MKDPKPLPNYVLIMDKMLVTLKSIYILKLVEVEMHVN